MGASMGGALALLASLQTNVHINGIVLMAPMVQIAEDAKPAACVQCFLQCALATLALC